MKKSRQLPPAAPSSSVHEARRCLVPAAIAASSRPAIEGFHPAIRQWFAMRFGEPTLPQREGWPLIRSRSNALLAAPTGTGKTLAAFLSALDQLFAQGAALADRTEVLYVSPLRALANDVQKNLEQPLSEIRALDASLPEIRVLVRTGDTPSKTRASMLRRPPHILVTTPESLYILLTSQGGRALLSTVHTVIVDEIHALLRDKRGAHLALSLERLEALVGNRTPSPRTERETSGDPAPSVRRIEATMGGRTPLLRIGLSATQNPLSEVARFLVGVGRECALVDAGHRRDMDLALELPQSPLSAVCSHEMWDEIYERIAELVRAHRSTIVFVNTRKLAERVAARLASGSRVNPAEVGCHHGSLSAARRHAAEQRLKAGELRVLVATASLELGIDIGDVDLAIQVGASRSIATLLQRVGRAGHGVERIPKGRIFPLTLDELVEAAALLRAVRTGILDRSPQPALALDILAQQIVAACVPEAWNEDALFAVVRRAWPYRDLTRQEFDQVVSAHAVGARPGRRRGLLHKDGVHGRIRATRGARITAITSGGAIPDNADYQVIVEPDGALVGTLNEDFAIESNGGDIFQLGTQSWRVLRVAGGVVRVADAKGAPPTIPFWLGEAPARTREVSAEISKIREDAVKPGGLAIPGVCETAARQIAEYVASGRDALGAIPTDRRLVLERFFDESGGMQLVLHAPFGGRINRALGLALRKRFCRGFGFELQAAANEEAIVLSLGPQHSFALDEVFDYLHPNTVRALLIQAVLPLPMFKTRWRWNASRSLLLARFRGGKRLPAPLVRMRADDLLTAAFPAVMACGETLAPGDIDVPMNEPIVRQTVQDCLHEAMDVDGLIEVLASLRDGRIEKHAIDTAAPSSFAQGVLAAQPYAFLDDAPLEERRTQAVAARRGLDPKTADEIGALDPDAIRRVREEAWPSPSDAEEMHEALLWMGYATSTEATRSGWNAWLQELEKTGRAVCERGRWFSREASREPQDVLRGRLEALGPVAANDPLIQEAGPLIYTLEREGIVMRGRFSGASGWCNRHLLARIHRYTLDRLRKEIEPVSAAEFLRFLACWQHVDEESQLEGPHGVAEVLEQLVGFEAPATAWDSSILPARVRNYRREWLDEITLRGEMAWGRLWGSRPGQIRTVPITFVPREQMDTWTSLCTGERRDVRDGHLQSGRVLSSVHHGWGRGVSSGHHGKEGALEGGARAIHDVLRNRGAMFSQEIERAAGLDRSDVEEGLRELVALGWVTCDSFGGLRALFPSAAARWQSARGRRFYRDMSGAGRWSLFRREVGRAEPPERPNAECASLELVARQMVRRTGILFRRMMLREKLPIAWRDLLRVLRELEARGELRGGRFVAGFDGEQYASPEAVALLRTVRRRQPSGHVLVAAADPLNWRGILTPDERISSLARQRVLVA